MEIDQEEIAKFWMNVEVDKSTKPLHNSKKWLGRCWKWKGSYFSRGYGRHFLHQKSYRAHRIAFIIFYGQIAEDKFICHRCDNPKCVNPKHLFLGTAKENTLDMIDKNRLSRQRSKHRDSISKFPGVSFRKESGKWRARIMRNYLTIWCKEFTSEEEAAKAREQQLQIISSYI